MHLKITTVWSFKQAGDCRLSASRRNDGVNGAGNEAISEGLYVGEESAQSDNYTSSESLQAALAGTLLDDKPCIHCCCVIVSRGRVVRSVRL